MNRGLLHRAAQRLAQLANGDAHHRITHRRLGPDSVEQGVFGHQAVRMSHQVVQHIEALRCQGNGLRPAPETDIIWVETEAAKVLGLGGGHPRTPLVLVGGSTLQTPAMWVEICSLISILPAPEEVWRSHSASYHSRHGRAGQKAWGVYPNVTRSLHHFYDSFMTSFPIACHTP